MPATTQTNLENPLREARCEGDMRSEARSTKSPEQANSQTWSVRGRWRRGRGRGRGLLAGEGLLFGKTKEAGSAQCVTPWLDTGRHGGRQIAHELHSSTKQDEETSKPRTRAWSLHGPRVAWLAGCGPQGLPVSHPGCSPLLWTSALAKAVARAPTTPGGWDLTLEAGTRPWRPSPGPGAQADGLGAQVLGSWPAVPLRPEA